MEALIREKQKEITDTLGRIDGKKFTLDPWERPDGRGGGISAVLEDGNVFERSGVNISFIGGTIPPAGVQKMRENHQSLDGHGLKPLNFEVAGLSLIVHPISPMVPTVHLNYRFFETRDENGAPQAWWFGGGSDLTPSYLFEDDAVFFHHVIKAAADKHDPSYYPEFKSWCDKYFWNTHRHEARGIGGLFFDDLTGDQEKIFAFVKDSLDGFLEAYVPIVEKRMNLPYTEAQKHWQQLRRGRYVEFNLVHDRGTAFGLQTPGARIESILCSMPRTASWEYCHEPEASSEEAKLVEVLKHPVDWASRTQSTYPDPLSS